MSPRIGLACDHWPRSRTLRAVNLGPTHRPEKVDFPSVVERRPGMPRRSDELRVLLRPFPAERMQAHEIGARIGNVKDDDAALIERASAAPLPG
jgi:hypothetical protein